MNDLKKSIWVASQEKFQPIEVGVNLLYCRRIASVALRYYA